MHDLRNGKQRPSGANTEHKGQMELPVLSDLQFIPVVVSGDVVHDTIPGVKALQPGSAFAVVFTS